MDNLDQYLKPDAAYNRLWAEYQKHGSLVIGVDFDNTLFDHHNTGESYEMVRQLVRDLKSIGCYITIWTGSNDLKFVGLFCSDNNIPFDSINEDAPHIEAKHSSRKIYANAFLDDRGGLICVYNDLTRLVKEVRNENK